ncbi:hypothetical protein HWV62_34389 [Athelia sp. TMB]|nr:hypothetical protein HWV62_34389 [Athelia sp. TMB]
MYPNQRDAAVPPICCLADSESCEPPVNDLLHNSLPPQSDTANIDEKIRVSQIHATSSRPVAKRTDLCNYAAASKGLISPLRHLPAEILSEIFIHTLPPFPFELLPSETPLVLELVCRRWRDVIRATPALWSCIALRLHTRSRRRDLAVASACLARSGTHPLSISLDFDYYGGSDGGYPALALIVAQCERWHTAYVQFQPTKAIRELADVKGRLVSLERLYVISSTGDTTPFEVFGLTPRLRFLHIAAKGYKHVAWDGASGLPWTGLATLAIDERHTNELLGVLADCQDVDHLDALISDDTCPAEIIRPIVQLANLRSLSLALPGVPTVLPTLILPALAQMARTTTSTTHCRQDLWHASARFDVLVSPSGCVVRELGVDDDVKHLEARDLVGILAACLS